MSRPSPHRSSGISRRRFLGVAGAAVALGAGVPWLAAPAAIGRLLPSQLPLPAPFWTAAPLSGS